jgi:hypothetical protein
MDAKTIQIFLPNGEPRGVRIAEITTRIIQAVAFPRTKLSEVLQRPEAQHVAVYFLFGGDGEQAKPIVYIGQTEDLATRFNSHNAKKDFWQSAVFVISRTHSFTQAHIRYLEWLSIQRATETNRYHLDNGNNSSKPHVPEAMGADINDAFDTTAFLLGTLGFPVFEPLTKPQERRQEDVFFCTGPDADGQGQLVEDGFVVLKGSMGRMTEAPSAKKWGWLDNLRLPLIEQGILKEDGTHYVFTEDFLFSSPSAASVVVLARTSNGWMDWKNNEGKTLHELKRAPEQNKVESE